MSSAGSKPRATAERGEVNDRRVTEEMTVLAGSGPAGTGHALVVVGVPATDSSGGAR